MVMACPIYALLVAVCEIDGDGMSYMCGAGACEEVGDAKGRAADGRGEELGGEEVGLEEVGR